MITLEVDGRYQGYNGQLTTHAFLGPIPGEYAEMFAVQQELMSKLYPMVRPGARLGELAELPRSSRREPVSSAES